MLVTNERVNFKTNGIRYDDVGDEDEYDPTTTEGVFDVDALSFSAKYRF